MSLVSAVIPAYNSERFLQSAIESALNQTYPSIEVVVVDDGSTDMTEDVVRSFNEDLPIRYICQEHSGQSVARNLGAQESQGDFIGFLDSDDLWTPDKIQLQVEALQASPDLDMVFGQARQFREDAQCFIGAPTPAQLPGTMLIRRSSWLRTPGFDPVWRVGEFIDWFLKATESGLKSDMVQRHILSRRLHGGNLGSSGHGREDYVRILKASLDRRRATTKSKESV